MHSELIGIDSLRGLTMPAEAELNEIYLRSVARYGTKRHADAFARLYTFLGLPGPPFVSGSHGVEPSREILGIWPTMVARDLVEADIGTKMVEVGR